MASQASWTEGYVSELDYTYGYYREMSPLHLELALLSKLQAHRVGRPLRYLELGFGQGVSLNIHAAANEGEFWGTDFNPAQAANARELAAASGANVKILDASFAELATRDDLPEFDVIVLHGIWTWISDENRQVIADIARRRLAVGGMLYVSYNTTPGWSSAMPLRHLMTLHAELASSEASGLAPRIDSAITFAESLVEANALYFRQNPAVAERLKSIKNHNRNYLAHEFFNADWHPMPFSEAAACLAGAKLSFAASANLASHIEIVNLSAEQQKLLASINHPVLRESVRDYCENQQFRRDIFIKGPRAMTSREQAEALTDWRFVLTTKESEITLKLRGQAGEAQLQAAVYQPLIAALARNRYQPKSVAELLAVPELKAAGPASIIQALIVLTGMSHVVPAQSEAAAARRRPATDALNAHILERAVHSQNISFLASPVSGGGVPVARLQQLMLRSIRRGKVTPQDVALDVWPVLASLGQRLIRDGKAIEQPADNIAELATLAREFMTNRLPILAALEVVDASRVSIPAEADVRTHAA